MNCLGRKKEVFLKAKKILIIFEHLLVIPLFLFFTVSDVKASYVSERNGHCAEGMPVIKVETKNTVYQANAPEGNIFSRIFVKAGSVSSGGGCFEYSTERTSDGCYLVKGIGENTANVTRIGDGKNCKDISHVEFAFSEKITIRQNSNDPGDNNDSNVNTNPKTSNSGNNNNQNNNNQNNNNSSSNILGESTNKGNGLTELPSTGSFLLQNILLLSLLPIGLKVRRMVR